MAYSLTYSYNSDSQSYSVIGYSNITTKDKVVIPDNYNNGTNGEHPVTSIGDRAFLDCYNLTNVTIGNSVTSIGGSAFNGCNSITSVTIPNSVTSIGGGAFYNCSSLTSISVDENNQSYKSIDGNLYTKDGTTLIQYAIGKTATSFVIPDSVTSIGNGAFYNCSSLMSVTILNSVTSIGSSAFVGCSSLIQLILFRPTPPDLGSSAIPDNVQSIYVKQSSKAAYQAAANWVAFATKIVGDNLYLSFIRFNQKNKEYIDGKISEFEISVPTRSQVDLLF